MCNNAAIAMGIDQVYLCSLVCCMDIRVMCVCVFTSWRTSLRGRIDLFSSFYLSATPPFSCSLGSLLHRSTACCLCGLTSHEYFKSLFFLFLLAEQRGLPVFINNKYTVKQIKKGKAKRRVSSFLCKDLAVR